jgi:SAM-dependent methyltransferase
MIESLNFLRCSVCKGELTQKIDSLQCSQCNVSYNVIDGIPDMIPALLDENIKGTVEIWENIGFDYGSYIDQTPKERLQAIDSPLLEQCVGGKMVLEVGCGTARLKNEVEREGSRYIGLEPSLNLLKQGFNKRKFDLVRGVGEYLPFPDNYFDTIIGGYCSFRYVKPDKCYPECARVLKPGGILAFTLFNYWLQAIQLTALNIKNRRLPSLPSSKKANDVSWVKNEINRLENSGFKVISILSTKKLPTKGIPFLNRVFGWQGYWKGNVGTLIGNDIIFICEKK